MKLKIAYFGTPSFSADLLEKLITSNLVDIKLVITQPDKLVGRDQTSTPSPVKLIAQKYHIEVFDHAEISELPALLITKDIDFGLVFSYGKIIKAELLSSPKMKFGDTGFGFLNIHPSLLPKYRGASPTVFPLLLGDKETGVSLMVMDEKMDHGPLLAQEKLAIEATDTTQILTTKLTSIAFDMISQFISQSLPSNPQTLIITPQDHLQTTFVRLLTRDDGLIPLELLQKALRGEPISTYEFPEIIKWYCQKNNIPLSSLSPVSQTLIPNMHRSLSPWPGLWTMVKINGLSKRLIIKQLIVSESSSADANAASATSDVASQFAIESVQLEGKTEVDFETFNKAYNLLK